MNQMTTLEDCVDRAFARLDQPVRDRFSIDPLGALRHDLRLQAEPARHLADKRNQGGACDGMSFLKDGVILYAPTPTSRRQNFTLAHELGHWLVEQIDDIFNRLLAQLDPPRALETLCDRIAQKLLLSDRTVDAVLAGELVQARHVRDLYSASSASIPVCAIALGTRLPGLGAVVVIDRRAQVVEYASVRPHNEHGWPVVHPWPGQVLADTHPLGRLEPGRAIRRRSYWETHWGQREDFYIDAVAEDRRTVAVLSDTDIWGVERFHAQTAREYDQRPQCEIRCCGEVRTVRGYPCSDCGEPYCPKCGRCRCDRRATAAVLCAGGCYMKYQAHLLVNGLCEDCR